MKVIPGISNELRDELERLDCAIIKDQRDILEIKKVLGMTDERIVQLDTKDVSAKKLNELKKRIEKIDKKITELKQQNNSVA